MLEIIKNQNSIEVKENGRSIFWEGGGYEDGITQLENAFIAVRNAGRAEGAAGMVANQHIQPIPQAAAPLQAHQEEPLGLPSIFDPRPLPPAPRPDSKLIANLPGGKETPLGLPSIFADMVQQPAAPVKTSTPATNVPGGREAPLGLPNVLAAMAPKQTPQTTTNKPNANGKETPLGLPSIF